MNFEFTENTLIIINWIYKNCRLDVGECLRFICSFNTSDGEWQCSIDLQEVNFGEDGADGQYCITIDSTEKGILPGRYTFDLLHLLNTGESISLITQNSGLIEIVPAAVPVQNLYKTNEIYSALPYRNQDYNNLKNPPTVNGAELRGEITNNKKIFDEKPTVDSSKLLTSGAVKENVYLKEELDVFFEEKSESGHTHSFSQLTDKPSINGITVEGDMDVNGLMYRRVLTSSDDLDDIFEDGVYVYSTSSLPQNAPFANAAVVEVFGVKSTSAQKIQRAYRYGSPGYSAFRPLYSGAWGKWTYPLVTEDNANSLVTDYVVQQGTSGAWSYRKWSSGLAECWGTVDITLSKDAYLWDGNIYCASGYGGSVLTSVFTAYTCVSIDPIQWYQIGASGRVTAGGTLEGNVFGKTTSVSSLTKGDTVTVNCIVKGRWK